MGFFDLGIDRREKTQKIRAQQRKEQLALNRDIKETERKERRAELERKRLENRTATVRAEERLYETQLRRKKAKKALSPLASLSSFKPITIKKRKQGKGLKAFSRKRKVTLL